MAKSDLPRRSDSDRRVRQAARFARVLRVLEFIQSQGRHGIKEMAAELECSVRTVHRDLNVLELAGVPWFYDHDEQRYSVRPGYNFPAMNLSDDELIGQAIATVITSHPGLNVTKGASPVTRKLGSNARHQSAKLLESVAGTTAILDLKLADHSRNHETVKTIQWALIRSRKLTGIYVSPYSPRPKRLELHPYRLCLVRQAWYLIARSNDSDEPRTYRVARFRALRAQDDDSIVPDDFDIKSYFGNAWGVFRGSESHRVQVQFSREAAGLVTETTWHSTQTVKRHRDGSVTLFFQVDGLSEIVHWVLAWSGRVAVIEPEALRLMVLKHLKSATALNGPR